MEVAEAVTSFSCGCGYFSLILHFVRKKKKENVVDERYNLLLFNRKKKHFYQPCPIFMLTGNNGEKTEKRKEI